MRKVEKQIQSLNESYSNAFLRTESCPRQIYRNHKGTSQAWRIESRFVDILRSIEIMRSRVYSNDHRVYISLCMSQQTECYRAPIQQFGELTKCELAVHYLEIFKQLSQVYERIFISLIFFALESICMDMKRNKYVQTCSNCLFSFKVKI